MNTGVNGMRELVVLFFIMLCVSVAALVQAERQLAEMAIEMQESRPYAVIGE